MQLSEARFRFEKATTEAKLKSEKVTVQLNLAMEAYRAQLDSYKDDIAQRCRMVDKVGVEKTLAILGPPPARPTPPSYVDVARSIDSP